MRQQSWDTNQRLLLVHAPNINLKQTSLGVLFDIDVDGEMGVHISHFILKTLRDANDQVVNDGLDSSECSNVFACAMVQFDINCILGRI